MLWFFSDPHFDHANIIKYCNRPFKHKDEMNDAIIQNINDRVSKDDELYCLGDWAFGSRKTLLQRSQVFLNRIHCKNVTLIKGNHDVREQKEIFPRFYDMYTVKVREGGEKKNIVLCHYPLRAWDKQHHGAFQIFGHCHGNLPDDRKLWSFDVGLDCHGMVPLSYDDVKEIMSHKEPLTDVRGRG